MSMTNLPTGKYTITSL